MAQGVYYVKKKQRGPKINVPLTKQDLDKLIDLFRKRTVSITTPKVTNVMAIIKIEIEARLVISIYIQGEEAD